MKINDDVIRLRIEYAKHLANEYNISVQDAEQIISNVNRETSFNVGDLIDAIIPIVKKIAGDINVTVTRDDGDGTEFDRA